PRRTEKRPSACERSKSRTSSADSPESPVLYLIRPMERHARRNLSTDIDRLRFDRAKRFLDAIGNRQDAPGCQTHARWAKFPCSRAAVARDVYEAAPAFLRRFAAAFGLSAEEEPKFVRLGLLGRVWGEWCKQALYMGPPALVAQLSRVEGWEF